MACGPYGRIRYPATSKVVDTNRIRRAFNLTSSVIFRAEVL